MNNVTATKGNVDEKVDDRQLEGNSLGNANANNTEAAACAPKKTIADSAGAALPDTNCPIPKVSIIIAAQRIKLDPDKILRHTIFALLMIFLREISNVILGIWRYVSCEIEGSESIRNETNHAVQSGSVEPPIRRIGIAA
ncbi:MAG: hypothetical protein ACREXM_07380 [Gammaproteobacteria bacterium]